MTIVARSRRTEYERRAMAPPDLVWRLNVEQYHGMINAGILTESDPVELLDGCLVPKMPKRPKHSLVNGLVFEAISRLLPEGWFADFQEPITTENSEPEPDVRVVRGERRDFLDRHPGGADLGLLVEVSDTTLNRDLDLKLKLYAQAGVAVYWVVNLPEHRLEVYSEPSGSSAEPGYGQRTVLKAGDDVALVLDGVEVGRLAVASLLP